ncbi:MAG: zinc metalloprotease HtpX [Candidatus Babeliales bacterium]
MWMNRLKTLLLLTLLSGIFLFIGHLFGGQHGLQIALIMALAMNFITYFFSEQIVLSLYRAQPLDRATYGWIYDTVHELANTMEMPAPKLWMVKTPMANAFATGRNPHHASVVVTTGIVDILEKHELRGVLAHELSHIKNRDVLIGTIAATIATAIGYVAHMMQYAAFWGSMHGKKRGGNPISMLLVAIFMPLAATLIQLAISRSREYLADETGACVSGDPLALASALEKLHTHVRHTHMDPRDTQHATTAALCIVHPFNGHGLVDLFSTHPPMHKRIARLKEMCHKIY